MNWHLSIRSIHWLSALIVLVMLALGLYMVDLDYYDPLYRDLPEWHMHIGMCFVPLLVLRLLIRAIHGRPALGSINPILRMLSILGHTALYGILIAMIVTGYLLTTAGGKSLLLFGVIEFPPVPLVLENAGEFFGKWHEYLSWALIALIAAHVCAALGHHFVIKDQVLLAMLGRASKDKSQPTTQKKEG